MANYQYPLDGRPDGAILGQSTGEKLAFYGSTPIVQRSGAAQATSAVGTASSADVTTALKAAVIEIMDTLAALGLWKGSA
jgi:hypothetical protein